MVPSGWLVGVGGVIFAITPVMVMRPILLPIGELTVRGYASGSIVTLWSCLPVRSCSETTIAGV